MLEAGQSREAETSVSKIHTITDFVIQLRTLDFSLRAMQGPQGNYKIRCTS